MPSGNRKGSTRSGNGPSRSRSGSSRVMFGHAPKLRKISEDGEDRSGQSSRKSRGDGNIEVPYTLTEKEFIEQFIERFPIEFHQGDKNTIESLKKYASALYDKLMAWAIVNRRDLTVPEEILDSKSVKEMNLFENLLEGEEDEEGNELYERGEIDEDRALTEKAQKFFDDMLNQPDEWVPIINLAAESLLDLPFEQRTYRLGERLPEIVKTKKQLAELAQKEELKKEKKSATGKQLSEAEAAAIMKKFQEDASEREKLEEEARKREQASAELHAQLEQAEKERVAAEEAQKAVSAAAVPETQAAPLPGGPVTPLGPVPTPGPSSAVGSLVSALGGVAAAKPGQPAMLPPAGAFPAPASTPQAGALRVAAPATTGTATMTNYPGYKANTPISVSTIVLPDDNTLRARYGDLAPLIRAVDGWPLDSAVTYLIQEAQKRVFQSRKGKVTKRSIWDRFMRRKYPLKGPSAEFENLTNLIGDFIVNVQTVSGEADETVRKNSFEYLNRQRATANIDEYLPNMRSYAPVEPVEEYDVSPDQFKELKKEQKKVEK